MIFVTVGTHEQPFDRLIHCIDNLKGDGILEEEIVLQTGYCMYEPKNCNWKKMIPYREMVENVSKAHIVITHGGPSSFLMPLQMGKVPIVVPRMVQFNEHINNHQVDFVKAVDEKMGNIIPIYEIEQLQEKIIHYDEIVSDMKVNNLSNNAEFNAQFSRIVDEMLGER